MAKRGRTVATANKRAPLTRARKAAASPAFQMTYSGDASGEQTTEEQDRASADRRPKRQLAITDTRTAERATRGPARARQSAVGASKGGRGQDRPTRTAVPPRTGGARASTQASRPRT
ncbi:hypothetical protein PUNSTDRAFT_112332 [Punctularia strigosozonata HHB-11173 SS5]|uniref:uncharacterized protein n=1 Tax=Punctularia strigosozonata (strain HHB-11173) TaxID=741275 RepID=UPI0004416C14|nr:uncharacterized protein PUNSTDRAFT_112332 [Punctularia strigosozonata HHB-11173 SS5]EIN10488.1 hypothetical protein PUNSTDRAFT_112332 [Punctularia strigosozonata HHB-11173 SS5]